MLRNPVLPGAVGPVAPRPVAAGAPATDATDAATARSRDVIGSLGSLSFASHPHSRAPQGLVASVRASLAFLPVLLAQAEEVYPSGQPGWLGRRLRFVLSALRHPRAHRAMVDFFSQPPFDGVLEAHPQLLQKIHKPYAYASAELDVPTRAALVARHYVLARERLGAPLHAAVAAGRETTFCEVALPQGHGTLGVRLGKHQRFEREGELTLSLIDPFGTLLYSACFLLVDGDVAGEVALLVGSLNGTAPVDVLRHLTKLSHGLRPASLMAFLLRQVAAVAGATSIRAVGRDTHAYRGHPRWDEIRFDYDAFWLEEGGERRADGLYTLPVGPRVRAAAELPAQKRAQYARRYAWLEQVTADVRARWSRARSSMGPAAASDAAAARTGTTATMATTSNTQGGEGGGHTAQG